MSTVINNSGETEKKESSAMSGGAGVIVGAVLVVLVLFVVVMLTLPYIRKQMDSITNTEPTINVVLPEIPTTFSPPGDNTTP